MEESDKNNQPPKPPIRDSSRKREEIKWNLLPLKKIREIDFTEKNQKQNSWNWFHGKNNYLEIPVEKEKKLNEKTPPLPLKKSLLQKRIYNLQLFSFG